MHEEIPRIGSAGYDAAKGALRNLTDPKAREQQVQSIPWRRAGEPREVASLALFLASDDADYATGQSFTLDGGLTMNLGQGA